MHLTQLYKTVCQQACVLFSVDHQIMSNLLAHEGREDVTPSSPLAEEEAEYSSSSDENSTGVYIDKESAKEDSSEEDEFTIRVRVGTTMQFCMGFNVNLLRVRRIFSKLL